MLWPVEGVEALRVGKPVFFKEKILSWGQQVEVVGLQTAQMSVINYLARAVRFCEYFRLCLCGTKVICYSPKRDTDSLCMVVIKT